MEKKTDSFFLASNKKPKKPQQNEKKDVKTKRQQNFDENREGIEKKSDITQPEDKKPFDKKLYRLKKYSKKYKLEQWEKQRKKALLRNYREEIKNDSVLGSYKPISFDDDEDAVDSNEQTVGRFVKHPDLIERESPKQNALKRNKNDPTWRAKVKNDKIMKAKLAQEQIEKAREEKKQKLKEYKKKKQERFKKLNKKNKKGQPVMAGRLELLLEKIQKDKGK